MKKTVSVLLVMLGLMAVLVLAGGAETLGAGDSVITGELLSIVAFVAMLGLFMVLLPIAVLKAER